MEIAAAKRIIEALADGVDPRTGEVLDPGSPIEQADVVRALHVALGLFGRREERRARKESLPAQAGKPWSLEDEYKLAAAFDLGRPIEEIAETFQRTPVSIAARLVRIGKVPDRDAAFAALR